MGQLDLFLTTNIFIPVILVLISITLQQSQYLCQQVHLALLGASFSINGMGQLDGQRNY